jgi:hypothetical protein
MLPRPGDPKASDVAGANIALVDALHLILVFILFECMHAHVFVQRMSMHTYAR